MYGIRSLQCEYCGKITTGRFSKEQRFCSRKCFSQSRINKIERVCQFCGKTFLIHPSKLNQEIKNVGRFCSVKCRAESLRCQPEVCEVCGKEFRPAYNTSKRFCSIECRRQARKKGQNVQCDWCEKIFYLTNARLGKHQHQFCSKDCLTAWQGRNKNVFTCKTCGKEFRWSPSRVKGNNPTYCSLECRDLDPERTNMLRNLNLKQQNLKPNHLEQAMYLVLDRLGVVYRRQQMIADKFCVDAFIPSVNLILQFDGDYWHGNPILFPTPDERQQKRMKIDASQNRYFEKCGYRVLRFWERDIKKRLDWVETEIIHAVQSLDA